MSDEVMMNSAEARTETGEIQSQSSAPPGEIQSSGAPESYADFTAPEGVVIDPAVIAEAAPIFKELGLSQDSAQKLVDFYNARVGNSTELAVRAVEEMRASWREQVKSDREIGSRIPAVQAEIGRALARLPADVTTAFKEAMNLTGAGDHPAVFRAFYELSKLVNEGTPVSGMAPSPHGQTKTGVVSPPSIASAMYPNLPH